MAQSPHNLFEAKIVKLTENDANCSFIDCLHGNENGEAPANEQTR